MRPIPAGVDDITMVSIYCQSIPGQELWNASQGSHSIINIVKGAEVEVGEGRWTCDDGMCVSWTLFTWFSPVSDVILKIQRSIASLP